jgi:hypothetical protein
MSAPEGGFAVLPGNEDLTLAEVKLLQEIGREMKLKKALAPVPAVDQHAYSERADSGRWRVDSDAVRVFRA